MKSTPNCNAGRITIDWAIPGKRFDRSIIMFANAWKGMLKDGANEATVLRKAKASILICRTLDLVICKPFDECPMREPDAGNPHVRFDEGEGACDFSQVPLYSTARFNSCSTCPSKDKTKTKKGLENFNLS